MAQTHQQKYIYVYSERGSNYLPVFYRLKESFQGQDVCVKTVSKKDLLDLQKFNSDHVVAFFLPGAAQNGEYDVRLGHDGFDAIRNYVRGGGHFIGICAGAYYASSKLEWSHEHKPHKQTKTPSLRFFNGLARGPISSITPHDDWHRMRAIHVRSDDPVLGRFKSIYWGGPEFISYDHYTNFDVLVSFNEGRLKSPCVIRKQEGAGTVTLSSIHPELTPTILRKLTPRNHAIHGTVLKVIRETHASDTQRSYLWSKIVSPVYDALNREQSSVPKDSRKTGLSFSPKKGIQ